MKKLFLAVSSMIVTGFIVKSYRKLRDRPESKEETYSLMKAAHKNHRDIESRRANARSTFAKMDAFHTQRDAGPTSLIDSLLPMAPGRFT